MSVIHSLFRRGGGPKSQIGVFVTADGVAAAQLSAGGAKPRLERCVYERQGAGDAVALSVVILASIYAATWAQDVYLREQQSLVTRIKADVHLSAQERLALQVYERTLIANRTNDAGKVVGARIHALVRITPLVLPVGFSALWLYAYFFAPHAAG